MLELQNVSYTYKDGKTVFENLNYKFADQKFYAIIGESGAGKTTLLSLLGGLDVPTSGHVLLDGRDLKEIGYTKYRREYVSLVFQSFNLLDYMTAYENLQVVDKNADPKILRTLGIDDTMMHRRVLQLSGGQQQRVAIARSIAQNTQILLLDEPTGNLDKKTEREIIGILKRIAKIKPVIVVTHSSFVADQADEIIDLTKL